jgi:hypothetical protein
MNSCLAHADSIHVWNIYGHLLSTVQLVLPNARAQSSHKHRSSYTSRELSAPLCCIYTRQFVCAIRTRVPVNYVCRAHFTHTRVLFNSTNRPHVCAFECPSNVRTVPYIHFLSANTQVLIRNAMTTRAY